MEPDKTNWKWVVAGSLLIIAIGPAFAYLMLRLGL